jgi:hypothetical protein
VRQIGTAERRARLGARHHLAAAGAATPAEAAAGVVALHATDPTSVFVSVQARSAASDVKAVEDALYEQRSLVRMHGMRRTMFVVPATLAPVVQSACTSAIAIAQRRRYAKLMAGAGIAVDEAWLAEVEDETAQALAARGEATGAELSGDVPRLRTRLLLNKGKRYEQSANITTWVLFLLAADGRIIRGRPRGTWVSSQYVWVPAERWVPDGFADLPPDAARTRLVREWLAAFGPGTLADLRWWTGLTAGQVKRALVEIDPVEVELDNGDTGLVLPGDLAPTEEPDPWVALLPALDATAMGWTGRSWYVGPHAPMLFDRSGNIGPTVWSDGRIVGGWAQRADGEVAYRLLEDVGRDRVAEVAAAAERLAAWIGPARVVPRFRTPLERELSA